MCFFKLNAFCLLSYYNDLFPYIFFFFSLFIQASICPRFSYHLFLFIKLLIISLFFFSLFISFLFLFFCIFSYLFSYLRFLFSIFLSSKLIYSYFFILNMPVILLVLIPSHYFTLFPESLTITKQLQAIMITQITQFILSPHKGEALKRKIQY